MQDLSCLSERERMVYEHLIFNWSNARIAKKMKITKYTVQTYISRIGIKLKLGLTKKEIINKMIDTQMSDRQALLEQL
jgi:DNA-binding NarL/FixJ family response regulator